MVFAGCIHVRMPWDKDEPTTQPAAGARAAKPMTKEQYLAKQVEDLKVQLALQKEQTAALNGRIKHLRQQVEELQLYKQQQAETIKVLKSAAEERDVLRGRAAAQTDQISNLKQQIASLEELLGKSDRAPEPDKDK